MQISWFRQVVTQIESDIYTLSGMHGNVSSHQDVHMTEGFVACIGEKFVKTCRYSARGPLWHI